VYYTLSTENAVIIIDIKHDENRTKRMRFRNKDVACNKYYNQVPMQYVVITKSITIAFNAILIVLVLKCSQTHSFVVP
jgi:hypothetical protein